MRRSFSGKRLRDTLSLQAGLAKGQEVSLFYLGVYLVGTNGVYVYAPSSGWSLPGRSPYSTLQYTHLFSRHTSAIHSPERPKEGQSPRPSHLPSLRWCRSRTSTGSARLLVHPTPNRSAKKEEKEKCPTQACFDLHLLYKVHHGSCSSPPIWSSDFMVIQNQGHAIHVGPRHPLPPVALVRTFSMTMANHTAATIQAKHSLGATGATSESSFILSHY